MFCRMLGMIGHFPFLRNVGSGHPVRKWARPVLVFGQSFMGLEKGNSVITRVNWRYAKLAKRLSARWQRRHHTQISNPYIQKGRTQYPKGVDLCFRSKPAITRWISSSLPIPHNWKMSIYVITCGGVCHYICHLTQICQQKFQPILLGCSSSQNPCCEIFAYSEQEGFCNNKNQQDENEYVNNNQFSF